MKARPTQTSQDCSAADALDWLKRRGTNKQIAELDRYAISVERAFGVPIGVIKKFAKGIGTDQRRARELWESGWYEARILAAFTGDPKELTVAEMNRWCDGFDNWAIVDAVCFHLFDRSPLAWRRVPVWARSKKEFTKRAAFALVWGLTVHDKLSDNAPFVMALALIEGAASDDRNFVKKAVDMALRARL